jgi:putative ABC transport system permease protein
MLKLDHANVPSRTQTDMRQADAIVPPRWPLKILRFFVKKKYLEEIEGDMEELFLENVEQYSLKKARQMYVWELLRLMRPILIRNLEVLQNINQFSMFRNYFKVSFRSLMKNPVNSFINVFGLAMAIGICVFGFGFTQWTLRTDQFHENKNSVYLVTFFAKREGVMQEHGKTPRPLGAMLKQDFTHIKNVCRVEDRRVIVKFHDNVFHEGIRFTDPEFLEMFTFPLKWGTANSLRDVNSMIISEEMSVKYFGDQNPVGQTLLVKFDKNTGKEFTISGVAKEFPKSRTISFNFLINFENLRTSEPAYDFQDWKKFANATLIQLDDPANLKSVESGMEKYRQMQNKAVDEEWAISSFSFVPLAILHRRSESIRDDISRSTQTNYISIVFIGVLAVFLLALACFNYINIAIATAAKRLKEIGVRKSVGATRKKVIVQFLSENVLITFFALLVGLILGYTFFIPGFESLWHFSMDFKLTDGTLWIFLSAMLLFTSVASGIYPSLYISKFQVVGILKGSVKFGQKNLLTKVLLCFQLIFSCIFITCSVLFAQNNSYLSKREWGYSQREALYANVPDQASYEQLSTLMTQSPDVVSISGSTHHIGKSHKTTVLRFPDREYEVDQLAVDARYLETLGVPLKEGRFFKNHEGSDRQAVVVNDLFVKTMDWKSPVGQQFRIDSIEYEVVGVAKDFHNYSFDALVRPIIFTVADKENYRYLSLKVKEGSEVKTFKTLQANWSKLFPETPFEGGYQEDVWGPYYTQLRIYDLVWKVFAFIAVTLATLGLYGLIRLNVDSRTKEFSIRKVLGAGLMNMTGSIMSPYFILFAVTLVIGTPIGYLLGKWLIEFSAPYHVPVDLSAVIIAQANLIFVLGITVSTQIRKVSTANPVNGLKVE